MSFSGDVFFQLFASLGSFLIEAEAAGAITGDSLKGVKLAFGAVDATDWAMEGTVTCARREDGRGALVGATGAATTTGAVGALGATATLAAALGAGLGAGAIVAAGLATALTVTALPFAGAGIGLAAALLGTLATVLTPGFAVDLVAASFFGVTLAELDLAAAALAIGLADFVAGAADLADFAGVAGLVAGFAAVLGTAALTGAALATVLAPADLAAFAGTAALPPTWGDALECFVFTSCLLADESVPLSCAALDAAEALFFEVDRSDSAGECTGFPLGNPISCKSETIISFPFQAPPAPTLLHRAYRNLTALAVPLFSYTKDCSNPCRRMSLGRSMPINTILLMRGSSAPQAGPRSEPMSWCTPWKMTFFSVPFMNSTPL